MNFTDLFIRRPVLATVVSLLVLVLGLRALASLPVRQFPKTENATVTVTTQYYGASAELVAGFITTPIESSVAEAQGIDYLTSDSVTGTSTVTAYLRLNYDSNRAQSEISSKVNAVLNQLPDRHAAAGHHGAGRRADRRHVPGIQQRDTAGQPDHRLRHPRRAAEAAGRARRAESAAARRAPVCPARLA